MKTSCNIDAVTQATQDTLCYVPHVATPTSAYKYPGESCNSNSECVGLGMCENGACKGAAQGEACTTTDDCAVGAYCNNRVCTALIAETDVSEGVMVGLYRVGVVCVVHRL